MSLSVDDLVSSLSSSHIGQEAIDLAALQAQLAQALFGQSATPNNARQVPRGYTQPCNTPTARTPSSGHAFGQMAVRIADDPEEDERMVEDLLIPSSPISTAPPSFNSQYPFTMHSQPISPPPNHFASYYPISSEPSSSASSSSSSVFTSTDPFYLAAMQQQQQQSASLFAHNGRLSQNSPFHAHTRQPPQHRESHNHHTLTLDTHPIFASAAY